jgi:hypothetical protein
MHGTNIKLDGKTEFVQLVAGHANGFVYGCCHIEFSCVVECTVDHPLRVPAL